MSVKNKFSLRLPFTASFFKYFKTRHYEVTMLRLWFLAIAILNPFFGYFLLLIDPTATDFISHRLLISCLSISFFIASYKIVFVKEHLTLFAYFCNYLITFWFAWIVFRNGYSFNYCFGIFIAICCTGVIFRNKNDILLFFLMTILIVSYPYFSINQPPINIGLLIAGILILAIIYSIMIFQREFITYHLEELNKDLNLLNQTLEEQVKERTKIAEEKTVKLLEKNKELERFASVASHDLKAPLRNIGAFTNLLGRKVQHLEDPAIKEYTQFIDGGVKRMTNIIDDLLDYSRLGQTAISFKTINIEKMLYIVINSIASASNRPDVTINIPKNLPTHILGNPRQLEQLFQNLIDNAIKYNKSPLKTVTISVSETSKSWSFSVKDNGIGIPEKYKNQVFEMFKRLHGNQEFQGTGIGLAICKRIVLNHKGIIRVNSTEGKGTTFYFTLSKNLPNNQPIKTSLLKLNQSVVNN